MSGGVGSLREVFDYCAGSRYADGGVSIVYQFLAQTYQSLLQEPNHRF